MTSGSSPKYKMPSGAGVVAALYVSTTFTDVFLFCSRVVRKSIARVLTVINQTQKENLRKFYKVSLGWGS